MLLPVSVLGGDIQALRFEATVAAVECILRTTTMLHIVVYRARGKECAHAFDYLSKHGTFAGKQRGSGYSWRSAMCVAFSPLLRAVLALVCLVMSRVSLASCMRKTILPRYL